MKHLSALLTFLTFVGLIGTQALLLAPADRNGSRDIAKIRARLTPVLTEQIEAKGFEFGAPVFLRIFKEERELEIWLAREDGFSLFRTYYICNHSGALGPKLREGDRQSPEGFYNVTSRAMNPNSQYHLSFNLGFPNAYDRDKDRTGSFLMVHGDCVSAGCYAMTDAGIEEIYVMAEAALKAGQPFFRVHAFPFRMTDARMEQALEHRWFNFWANLKEGYDVFERTKLPPKVSASGGVYLFAEG